MLDTTTDQVVSAFGAAKNLNAALKNFLRKEVRSNDPLARFAKDFRGAASTGRPAAVKTFIERHLEGNEVAFLLVARYAHSEFIESLVGEIITAYADDFNGTYTKAEEGIEIKDRAKFSAIVKEVSNKIDAALEKAGLPATNFMKNTVLITVFDQDVLVEVLGLLQ